VFGPPRIRKLVKMGASFYSNLNNLEIFDYKMMSDKVFEYKSIDGAKFKFDVCGNKACGNHHPSVQGGEESKHLMEEEKKGGERKMSIDSGASHSTDDQSPLYGFTDNYVSIVPVKVMSK